MEAVEEIVTLVLLVVLAGMAFVVLRDWWRDK